MSGGSQNDASGPKQPPSETDWDRSERRSTWIALAIALTPIPLALLISWILGVLPWREPQPSPVVEFPDASHAPERPGHGDRH